MLHLHVGLAVSPHCMGFNLLLWPMEQLPSGKQKEAVCDTEERLTWITVNWILSVTWKWYIAAHI